LCNRATSLRNVVTGRCVRCAICSYGIADYSLAERYGIKWLKKVCFAAERALLGEAIERLPQKQGCPLTVIGFLRLPFCFSCNLRLRLGGGLIGQARKEHAAATFQSPSTVVHIGEMFPCAEEKRTEPSLFPIGARVRTSLGQVSEKRASDPAHPLGHILVCA
jgi:hypothetical protein